MNFRVLEGGKRQFPFVCTFCGETFEQRNELEAHWAGNSRCRRNRMVNTPTQSQYSTTAGATPVCACGGEGPVHSGTDGRCLHCGTCLVFSLAGFRDD